MNKQKKRAVSCPCLRNVVYFSYESTFYEQATPFRASLLHIASFGLRASACRHRPSSGGDGRPGRIRPGADRA